MAWSLVIPVKRLALAKSRLGGTVRPGLALAFAQDTVAAVLATPAVIRVVVVTDDEEVRAAVTAMGAQVRPDVARGGLNAAVRAGASYAVGTAGAHPVAALPSDLPALTPVELGESLAAAAEHPHAFVADASGSGTTLLTAAAGALDPRYGPDSAAEHDRCGAARLAWRWPGLRQDVDTVEDLLAARALGVGAATASILAIVTPRSALRVSALMSDPGGPRTARRRS